MRDYENIYYCDRETREEVWEIINDPCVSYFTKKIIEQGLQKDCVDAVNYVQAALDALKIVETHLLKKSV